MSIMSQFLKTLHILPYRDRNNEKMAMMPTWEELYWCDHTTTSQGTTPEATKAVKHLP